jgi:hypothetical protein
MATMNAVFGYVKLQQPDFKFGSTTEKEFTVDCVVEKADAKAWNKKYPKQKAKELDRADFEKIYKIDAPYEGDEIFVIKMKKPAQYKDLTPIPDALRPRVFEKGDSGKLVDITKDKLVSNGSKGVVSYDEVSNDFGTFAKLKAIRVDHLIEYKKAGGAANYDELGEVESLATDFDEVPERELSQAQKAAHSKAADFEDEDPEDDKLPF